MGNLDALIQHHLGTPVNQDIKNSLYDAPIGAKRGGILFLPHRAWTPSACYGRRDVETHSTDGTVDVDGVAYEWHLQREPHQSDDEGWKGMTIALVAQGGKRAAWVEFPPPKRLLKGLPRGRLQLDDATIARCVRAALSAGWEPMSRGKPVVFTVDAQGN